LPATCPICGKSLESLKPGSSESRRKTADPVIGGRRQGWINVAVAILAIGSLCLVAIKWTGVWPPQDRGDGVAAKDEQASTETAPTPTSKSGESAKQKSGKSTQDGPVAPGSTDVPATATKETPPVEPKESAPAVPAAPLAREFDAEAAPVLPAEPVMEDPNALPPAALAGEPVELDDPAGPYEIPDVSGHEQIDLEGRIQTLKIGAVNGEAKVNAFDLDAREIVVTGGVNGRATVNLRAPNGIVEFRDSGINGETSLTIDAPGGKVVFARGAQINGSSRVTITAREVVFGDSIGGGSEVTVTLTGAGKLQCADLTGGARLYYKKAEADAPDPVIEHGTIQPGADMKMGE
jgi:hypothetical protein